MLVLLSLAVQQQEDQLEERLRNHMVNIARAQQRVKKVSDFPHRFTELFFDEFISNAMSSLPNTQQEENVSQIQTVLETTAAFHKSSFECAINKVFTRFISSVQSSLDSEMSSTLTKLKDVILSPFVEQQQEPHQEEPPYCPEFDYTFGRFGL